MLAQVHASAATVMVDQQRAIWITVIVTAIAAILGLLFAGLVGAGITRPVRLLLQGTREVEAGQLDRSIDVVTRDEIGQLTAAFNRMVGQLRQKEQMRRTFGRYIDPRVAEGLINQSAAAATEGQRRVMTVMFCDMKGFTGLSEGMTPQGLVKVMNRYLSTMSEPIRAQQGIIDKYIGDAIMAYWGPPFADEADEARLACLAAIDMMDRIGGLRKELPELLGVRTIPTECDLRIGVATGEALVGSIGSEFMMSFTVMGDTVNLASRLESANKLYGTRCLVSQATIAAAAQAVEAREIDRLVVAGQTRPQIVFEIMGRGGELSAEQIALRAHYSDGLAAYRARHWDEATSASEGGAGGGARRWTLHGPPHPRRELARQSARAPIGMVHGVSIRKIQRPDLLRSVDRKGFASQPRSLPPNLRSCAPRRDAISFGPQYNTATKCSK